MGIVIKICALLQIFLPILENRELSTQVLATKSIRIYYSEQNRADKWLCVNIFCIFAMFSTLNDEMQYNFLEKNFIFMVVLAVKDAGTDVI